MIYEKVKTGSYWTKPEVLVLLHDSVYDISIFSTGTGSGIREKEPVDLRPGDKWSPNP